MRGNKAVEDLNSNHVMDFAHPLESPLLVDSPLMTPGPRQGEPFAKLESKVLKGEALILGSVSTCDGPVESKGFSSSAS